MRRHPRHRACTLLLCDIADYGEICARKGELAAQILTRDFFDHVKRILPTFIKRAGDSGFLARFEQPTEAIRFALSLQAPGHGVVSHAGLQFRFSIHFGDVQHSETFYGNEVFGDEINVAARLNNLAEPGQIALSQTAFDRLAAEEKTLAGAGETMAIRGKGEVRIYRIRVAAP